MVSLKVAKLVASMVVLMVMMDDSLVVYSVDQMAACLVALMAVSRVALKAVQLENESAQLSMFLCLLSPSERDNRTEGMQGH